MKEISAHEGRRSAHLRLVLLALALLGLLAAAVVAWHSVPWRQPAGRELVALDLFHGAFALGIVAVVASTALLLQPRRQTLRAGWQRAGVPRRAALLLAGLVAVELLLAIGFWLTADHGVHRLGYLRAIFFLGGERNVVATLSALQLLLAAGLALRCAQVLPAPTAGRGTWLWVAAVCAYMALDEFFMLHETVGLLTMQAGWIGTPDSGIVELGGWRVRPWTLIFLPIAALVGGLLARHMHRLLDARLFALLVVAAVLFVGGAVGVENLLAHRLASGSALASGAEARLYLMAEEVMEMFGVSLAVYVFAHGAHALPGPRAALQPAEAAGGAATRTA